MPVTILGALVVGGLGAPVRLRVWQDKNDGSVLQPDPNTLPHNDSRRALDLAQLYASAVLGWPSDRTIHWAIQHAVNPAFRIPAMRGPSIFGPFCLALLRSVAVDSPGSVKPAGADPGALISSTRTDGVAISAAFNPRSGCFQQVGGIELKIAALTALGPQTCQVFVVAHNQTILLPIDDQTPDYQVYRLANGQLSVPVVRALDPLDAAKRIFSLQAFSGLTC